MTPAEALTQRGAADVALRQIRAEIRRATSTLPAEARREVLEELVTIIDELITAIDEIHFVEDEL